MLARVVIVAEVGFEAPKLADLLARLAPAASAVHTIVRLPPASLFGLWSAPAAPPPPETPLAREVRARLPAWNAEETREVVTEVDVATIARAVGEIRADAVILWRSNREGSRKIAAIVDELSEHVRVTTLVASADVARANPGPLAFLVDVVGAGRRLDEPLAFLRAHATPVDRVTLLAVDDPPPDIVDARAELVASAGHLAAPVTLVPRPWDLQPDRVLNRFAAENAVDLIVTAMDVDRGLAGTETRFLDEVGVPVLFLPPNDPAPRDALFDVPLDAPDVFWRDGDTLRLAIEGLDLVGLPTTLPTGDVTVVANGAPIGAFPLEKGTLDLPITAPLRNEPPAVLGLARSPIPDAAAAEGLVELRLAVLRPGEARVRLFDAAMPPEGLAEVRRLAGDGVLLVGVRLDDRRAVRDLRAAVAATGITPPRVVDAGQILDDGRPSDLPGGQAFVRLGRVAARLRADGVFVDAVVHGDDRILADRGFAFLSPAGLAALSDDDLRLRVAMASRPGPRLDELAGAPAVAGNRVVFEPDNTEARARVLAMLEGARERIAVQCYIVSDDPIAREVEAALVLAATRGVKVRLLVDALYSGHDAFGLTNPLLKRLSAAPGVEVRAYRPLDHVPTFEDLKQRNHRKVLVVDGTVAVVSGRNLARMYYTGFGEVAVHPGSGFEDVPFLDASAAIEGPLVAGIEAGFSREWVAAGGAPFPLSPSPDPVGATTSRLVLHTGFSDAYGLDAYLALIDGARRSMTLVNSFAIQFELQHALLRAIRRGVHVRAIFGNNCPLWGSGVPFPGSGNGVRELYDQVVVGRIDTLAKAGAEAWELTLRDLPGWDPVLGAVRPYVHAKVMVVDEEILTVGSANLDICASYYESEAMVVNEDPALAAEALRAIEAMLVHSRRVDPSDPDWQARASRRAWLSDHWPSQVW